MTGGRAPWLAHLPGGPLWVLLAVMLCGSLPAHADTTCTAAATPLAFGSVGNLAGTAATSSMNVQITCATSGLQVLANVRVRLCLGVGSGSAAAAIVPLRQMVNTAGDALGFQLYADATLQSVVGLQPGAVPAPRDVQLSYQSPILGGIGTTTATLHARIPANQVPSAGSHASTFSGADVTLTYAFNEATVLNTAVMPDTCNSPAAKGTKKAVAAFPFAATATVLPQCGSYLTTDMDFGSVPGRLAAAIEQTAQLSLTCLRRTAYTVALDNGLYASNGVRRMRHATQPDAFIPYELYRDSARSQSWGAVTGVDTLAGIGTGATQQIVIYGRAPPTTGAMPAAGPYSDRVTVVISY